MRILQLVLGILLGVLTLVGIPGFFSAGAKEASVVFGASFGFLFLLTCAFCLIYNGVKKR